jgi:chromosome segregation ATPase
MATKEQIWAAADTISADGGNPTLAAVRAYMGGGSYTDISAAMQSWRATQQASSTPIREPAPSVITDRLSSLGSELWAAALELANARLQFEREALEQARQEAEETRKEAAALADALAADLDKAQADIATLSEQLVVSITKQEQQQTVINQETVAAIENKHRAELAEAAREELKVRTDQLSGLLKEAQAENLANHERHQVEIDRAKAEAAATTTQQLAQMQKEAENARVAEQACQARLEAAAREIDSLKAQNKEERAEAKAANEKAAELVGRLKLYEEQAIKKTPTPRKPKEVKQ